MSKRAGLIAGAVILSGAGVALVVSKVKAGEGGAEALPVSFSKPVVFIESYHEAPGWGVPIVSCDVTNPNDQAVKTTISLWAYNSYYYPGYGQVESTFEIKQGAVTVTIEPHQTYKYYFDGQEAAALLSGQSTYDFWLEDSVGTQSPKTTASTP
jgi:hypothetical protein